MISVLHPGLFTTIQDIGRINYRRYGMPESGAMDNYNAYLANWLVENSANAALLEITMSGPVLNFETDCIIGLAGADMKATVNKKAIVNYKAHQIIAGDTLQLAQAVKGCRTYLAVNGGIAGNMFLKSRSTYSLAGVGGFKGRPLKKGDALTLTSPAKISNLKEVPEHLQMKFASDPIIRFTQGPEFKFITEDSPMGLAGNYKVHMNSDRMAIRLTGFIGDVAEKEIISSPVNKGTIQILPDNDLVVLMNDGQVSGGYPRLGNIISADLHLLAQVKPGGQLSLLPVNLPEAIELWEHQQKLLHSLI